MKLVRQTIPLTFFNTFVLQLEANRGLLIESIKTCKTDNIARFNVWRIFLEVIPTQGTWEDTVLQIDCTRKRFLELKEEARTGIKQGFLPKEAQVSKNPLMKVVAKPEKR